MALKSRKKAQVEGDNNIFWTTMSDLLLGLAIIFMTLFVLAMTGFRNKNLNRKKSRLKLVKN